MSTQLATASLPTREQITEFLSLFFPWVFGDGDTSPEQERVIKRLQKISAENPLTLSHFKALLNLFWSAPSKGFFIFYFLRVPENLPYHVDGPPQLGQDAIETLAQLKWGTNRFFVDALFFFGDFLRAYDKLSEMSYEQLETFFTKERVDSKEMRTRGPSVSLEHIEPQDRYLIAEVACKSYTCPPASAEPRLFDILLQQYRSMGLGHVKVEDIVDGACAGHADDYQLQLALPFATEEFGKEFVDSEEALREKVAGVMRRFQVAREAGVQNTVTYLTICSELDVYVATSMRNQADFIDTAENCRTIFEDPSLEQFHLRYFDPTLSAAQCHEDKGLIECLVVEQAKTVVYFAGEKDSWGKDTEASMALTFGKPVIIYCPATKEGQQRMNIFRDIHPLSRLIHHKTGVAVGALITSDLRVVTQLLYRIFTNSMEYDVRHSGDGYFRLRERLTQSIVRLSTNDRLLRRTFWKRYGH